MSKKQAHCIHHTHWDPIWYFSAEEAVTQFVYNMKELLNRLQDGSVKDFFLDGQTAALEDYLKLHPEDQDLIKKLVEDKKLIIGPFNSQLDCFISSGEAVINNLRLGMNYANQLGGSSHIAYLPDSFGHSYDFPKIFNLFDIKDFIITRGVGDEYGLKSEFFLESNDGSQLLVHTMIAGYGYGTYGFRDGTLLTDEAEDYNKLNVHALIDRLIRYSSLDNAFVFPIGFDQNPVILDIEEKITQYNKQSQHYHFKYTTWEAFMDYVRQHGKALKTHKGELYSTQYHRIHRSIFSARSDIKTIQDNVERILTYEVQPLMTMLDGLGVPYNHALINDAWDTLIRTQTHASATMTDETNAYSKAQSLSALRKTTAMKVYLMKIVAISKPRTDKMMPLVIYHTLPYKQSVVRTYKIYTKHPIFSLKKGEETIDYTIVNQTTCYGGVIRKDKNLMNEDKHYYETTIVFELPFEGISYQTLQIYDGDQQHTQQVMSNQQTIENDHYRITVSNGINIDDKTSNQRHQKAMYLEDTGDAGDNYDYSPPEADLTVIDDFSDAVITNSISSTLYSRLTLEGSFLVPKHLEDRKQNELSSPIAYTLTVTLKNNSNVIEVALDIDNQAKNHRLRLVVKTKTPNTHSYAGTQYSIIKRDTSPNTLKIWEKEQYFEEPSPHYPLLNHVSSVGDKTTTTVYTRSVKEYEFIGKQKEDIALTLFRSVGHLGLPDLIRRPGRPSGLANKIFETPESQMIGKQSFKIGISYTANFDENHVTNTYVRYATDLLYYQHQFYNTTIFNMAYFPTNPLEHALPDSYSLLNFEEGEAVFGTLIKNQQDQTTILRVFNSKEATIKYTLKYGLNRLSIYEMDSDEKKVYNYPTHLKAGQLTNLQLKD